MLVRMRYCQFPSIKLSSVLFFIGQFLLENIGNNPQSKPPEHVHAALEETVDSGMCIQKIYVKKLKYQIINALEFSTRPIFLVDPSAEIPDNSVPSLLNTKPRNFSIRIQRVPFPVDANNSSSKKTQRYDRNVRIRHSENMHQEDHMRRSKRTATRVQKYNYNEVQCFHCNKKFRGDFSSMHYSGRTLCSAKCLREASEI